MFSPVHWSLLLGTFQSRPFISWSKRSRRGFHGYRYMSPLTHMAPFPLWVSETLYHLRFPIPYSPQNPVQVQYPSIDPGVCVGHNQKGQRFKYHSYFYKPLTILIAELKNLLPCFRWDDPFRSDFGDFDWGNGLVQFYHLFFGILYYSLDRLW